MAWYRAGTVSVTNNNTAVTGVGTAWVTAATLGETFLGPDGQSYEIVAINSATSMTIAPAYKGSTAAGQGYAIMPTQGYLRDLAAAAAQLVESYSTVKNNAGTGKFAAGTSANPSLRNAADENTGVNFKGNDQIALVTAGAERLAIGATGLPSGTTADHLMNRGNHTGSQAMSSIAGLSAALADKAPLASPVFTGWPSTPSLKFANVASGDVTTIDYYEEGAFTPTLQGSTNAGAPTYLANIGLYTRIGNRVMYSIRVQIGSKGGLTGAIRLGNLPFIARNSTPARSPCSVSHMVGIVAGATFWCGSVDNGAATISMQKYTSSSPNAFSSLLDTDIADAFSIYVSGHYEV